MLVRLLIVSVVCLLVSSEDEDGEKIYSIYETVDKIRADGFPAETHHVTTSDGYILEMHRIPYGRAVEVEEDRPVVFLMHGLMSASNAYVAIGPDYSVAYNLADAGFDVWMGNARGNKNSRHHVFLNPDDNQEKFEFFDFTFEEIGIIDLPAMIDYVLAYTGKDKLHYIGHSQGGTVFLVMASMVPEYNQKLSSVHLLAGVGYMEYFPQEDLKRTARLTDFIYSLALRMGVVELYPPNSTEMVPVNLFPGGLFPYRTADYCAGDLSKSHTCELFGTKHISRQTEEVGPDLSQPGAAFKQIAHYGQNIRDKLFRRYHHGSNGNQALYGSTTPPAYNLSLITSNVTMHYTVSDELLHENDVLAMVSDMPNAVARKVARDSFTHEDFAIAFDAKELVTDYIIEEIAKYEKGNIIIIEEGSGTDPSGIEEIPPDIEMEPVTSQVTTEISPDIEVEPVTSQVTTEISPDIEVEPVTSQVTTEIPPDIEVEHVTSQDTTEIPPDIEVEPVTSQDTTEIPPDIEVEPVTSQDTTDNPVNEALVVEPTPGSAHMNGAMISLTLMVLGLYGILN